MNAGDLALYENDGLVHVVVDAIFGTDGLFIRFKCTSDEWRHGDTCIDMNGRHVTCLLCATLTR